MTIKLRNGKELYCDRAEFDDTGTKLILDGYQTIKVKDVLIILPAF